MRELARSIKRLIAAMLVKIIGRLLQSPAINNRQSFKIWEQRGYHVTKVHFYQPIPDTRELAKAYPGRSPLPGIDLRVDSQLHLLREVFPQFAGEYNNFPAQPTSPNSFWLDNGVFVGIDPHVYYCMIRHLKPAKVIEVGAGFSTLAAAQACEKNGDTRLLAVEPYPREFIAQEVHGIEHINQKAESLGIKFFAQLGENDILFIDSSHVVRTGGDVCFLILDVLPTLAKGVIVHFHDIFLPFDYPEEWPLEHHNFWTEQYMLQAYLAENSKVEVLFSNNLMAQDYPDELKTAFPNALRWTGGSFWFRRI